MGKMNHDELYKQAKYYDIAFDFRDVKKECDFFIQVHGKEKPNGFLELGAGPAVHTIEMAKRGVRACAMDLSEHMVKYGQEKAKSEDTEIDYICDNMIDFKTNNRFDIAVLLMASTGYIHTNNDFVRHLQRVAESLNDGGVYILEMSHPRDLFAGTNNEPASTITDWEMKKGGITVKTQWGKQGDRFDPIRQIDETSVLLTVDDNGNKTIIEDTSPQRLYSHQEICALVKLSGCFEIKNLYGSLDMDIPFNNEDKAWRMVPVLKKK